MSLEYRDEAETEEASIQAPPLPIPMPIYTVVLLICMSAVFIAQMISGLDRSILIAGFVKPAFLIDDEYWRIITGAALHGSIAHILMNGYALFSFGRLMELLTNRAHVANVFLLSAIGGGFLSLVFLPDGISVGASGGIVGIIGYLVVYAFKRRQFVSAQFRRSLLINIGFILIFGLVLSQVIDNYGHIGGLLTGIVYALIQVPSNEYKNPQDAGPFAKITGLASLAVYIVMSAFAILRIVAVR